MNYWFISLKYTYFYNENSLLTNKKKSIMMNMNGHTIRRPIRPSQSDNDNVIE